MYVPAAENVVEYSLADIYDPLGMPPTLVKAHNDFDKAVAPTGPNPSQPKPAEKWYFSSNSTKNTPPFCLPGLTLKSRGCVPKMDQPIRAKICIKLSQMRCINKISLHVSKFLLGYLRAERRGL